MGSKYFSVCRAGHTTVTPELLYSSRLLVVHLGPATLPLPTGLLYIPGEVSSDWLVWPHAEL